MERDIYPMNNHLQQSATLLQNRPCNILSCYTYQGNAILRKSSATCISTTFPIFTNGSRLLARNDVLDYFLSKINPPKPHNLFICNMLQFLRPYSELFIFTQMKCPRCRYVGCYGNYCNTITSRATKKPFVTHLCWP